MRTALAPDDFTLPERPHRPGSGSQPDLRLLTEAKATCPKVTDPARWKENRSYRAGWALYEAGFYWEAHEVWEAVWMACRPNSVEQLFLKAVIQLTNSRLKHAMGKKKAAKRLDDEVSRLLTEVKVVLGAEIRIFMGVDLRVFEHQ